MIQIYNTNQANEWDKLVHSFPNYDVYYLSGYGKGFQLQGDGDPYLFYYEENGIRGIYVFMKRKTAIEGIYDSITPYGYGGFLLDGEVSEENIKALWKAYVKHMEHEGIIDNFVRYHPVLSNAIPMKVCSEVIELGKTVAMDLSSKDVIWKNLHSKNRNMIRKAIKNGIIIKHGQKWELFIEFMKIYNATMDKNQAEKYYYFKPEFYRSIYEDLKENYEMFWAEYNGKIIAISLMLFANGHLNYHLSGSELQYRNLAPSNLLLYKAAIWGVKKGMKTFHLGGGVGSKEDNLYKFKIAFNRFSDYHFSISKCIFNQTKYDELVAKRATQEEHFNKDSKFFPLYRS